MCFSKPKVDDSALRFQQEEAARARQEEERRTRRINRGMHDIASIFEGGRYRSGFTEREVQVPGEERAITVIPGEPGGNVEGPRGNRYVPGTPSTFRVGDRTFNSRAEAEAAAAAIPQTRVERTPTFAVSQGITPYLDQRRSALEDFNFSQLADQQSDAQDDLTFALARAGLGRSTVASERQSDFENEIALAAAKIQSDIESDISSTRRNFERERQAAEAALRASGDRSSAVDAATRSVANLSEAPSLSILPDLFAGAASGIGAARTGFDGAEVTRLLDGLPPLRTRSEGQIVGRG